MDTKKSCECLKPFPHVGFLEGLDEGQATFMLTQFNMHEAWITSPKVGQAFGVEFADHTVQNDPQVTHVKTGIDGTTQPLTHIILYRI